MLNIALVASKRGGVNQVHASNSNCSRRRRIAANVHQSQDRAYSNTISGCTAKSAVGKKVDYYPTYFPSLFATQQRIILDYLAIYLHSY
jgi:hypothetical protein